MSGVGSPRWPHPRHRRTLAGGKKSRGRRPADSRRHSGAPKTGSTTAPLRMPKIGGHRAEPKQPRGHHRQSRRRADELDLMSPWAIARLGGVLRGPCGAEGGCGAVEASVAAGPVFRWPRRRCSLQPCRSPVVRMWPWKASGAGQPSLNQAAPWGVRSPARKPRPAKLRGVGERATVRHSPPPEQ